jgi:gliding motility-associated-like protein
MKMGNWVLEIMPFIWTIFTVKEVIPPFLPMWNPACIHYTPLIKSGVDAIQVGVVGVAKFFTPNNDNINDVLAIKGVTSEFYASGNFLVFDRYGKLVGQIDPFQKGWSGLYNGKPLSPSDYWYTLELTDHEGMIHRRNGHFTLKQ